MSILPTFKEIDVWIWCKSPLNVGLPEYEKSIAQHAIRTSIDTDYIAFLTGIKNLKDATLFQENEQKLIKTEYLHVLKKKEVSGMIEIDNALLDLNICAVNSVVIFMKGKAQIPIYLTNV